MATKTPTVPEHLVPKLGKSIDPEGRYHIWMAKPRTLSDGRTKLSPAKEYRDVKGSVVLEVLEDIRDAQVA